MSIPLRRTAVSHHADRLRIVVLGYLVRGPLGGLAWHHLNYLLGLHRLGHEVLFLEDSDDYPACYDPSRHVVDTDPTYGLGFTDAAMTRLGLGGNWAYFDAHRAQWHGPMGSQAHAFCASADVLLNISGVNPLREWSAAVPVRALIDTDPLFTQIRHLHEPDRRALALAHNRFFTFGESIPTGQSRVPDDGLPWRPTRQPVVLEAWPCQPPSDDGPVTTIMQWDSYQEQHHEDVTYQMKSRSFADYVDLPSLAGTPLTLALGGSEAPRQRLLEHGWTLHDPMPISRDPWTYQRYIQQAKAEWSVAKHGYVASRSGWFSERSACFLASGRPVLLQDTGFSGHLPVGRGLLAFSSLAEADEALDWLHADYAGHCQAARQIAEQYFASETVLTELLARIASEPAMTLDDAMVAESEQ